MHPSSSSPPVLYLEDDNDDDNDYISRAAASHDKELPGTKRKLINTNVRINSSIVNWSKRQRSDHYQQQSQPLQNVIDFDPDPEPILLDPDEYIIEEPDTHSFRSFDWTIQTQSPALASPPALVPSKLPSNPVPSSSRTMVAPAINVNYTTKRHVDKPEATPVKNPNDKLTQQQRKPVATSAPRPSLALLTLPKPTVTCLRSSTRRGRPLKNSRIPQTQSTSTSSPLRQRSEQWIPVSASPSPPRQISRSLSSIPSLSTAPPAIPRSPVNNSITEIRRQLLNGTGLFSAFHDSRYYQCNICKFKSVTSSTLLQHLFTHMFFCEQCSFYTYSHYNLSQHIFEKHIVTEPEPTSDASNPKSFDLLYVTRCADGTFALCMDSSSSSSTATTNKVANHDQRLIISSATFNEQQQQQQSQNKALKKKSVKPKELSPQEDNDIVVLSEKGDTNRRSSVIVKGKEKQYQSYVLMKHRRIYSLKKRTCLHALNLEYDICRENTIRHMCETQETFKRRKFLTKFQKTRLIDEVADCLRTIVNDIVNTEDNSQQSSLICALRNDILASILSTNDLDSITKTLKLTNKYTECMEQKKLYDHEHFLRASRKHMFVLSSPEIHHNEQSIICSLHSSMTNGDSIFTQTKLNKIPVDCSSAQRNSKKSSNKPAPTNHFKANDERNINTNQPPPSLPLPPSIPLRPVIPKPSHPLPNPSLPAIIDRNNNSVTPANSNLSSTKTPSFIVLD